MSTSETREAISEREAIAKQAVAHRQSIGKGTPDVHLRELIEFTQDVTSRAFFKERAKVPFWYERQEKVGVSDAKIVGRLADAWASDKRNIDRAAAFVKRPSKPPGTGLVRGFCIARLKSLTSKSWTTYQYGPGIDDREQVLVCVALDDLNPENGFFTQLSQGDDICIDGKEELILPPTGGGLAVFIWVDV